MSCSSCSCGGCGCSVCQPANTIFSSTCQDPGVANTGAALSVLDNNFCPRRLANSAGLVVINLTPQGYQVSATTEPMVSFSNFSVASGGTVGSIVVQGSDGILRTLTAPNTAGLYLSTNASGQFILGPLPTFSVPDPLNVTTANITNLTATSFTLTGAMIASGLATGTIASLIGVDAGGNVVKGTTTSTGVQAEMFYESAIFPAPNPTPNSSATAGGILIIGNRLFNTGGSLITITNTQTLTVAVAGNYLFYWTAEIAYTGGSSGTPTVQMLINGVIANYANSRPAISTTTQRTAFISGVHGRTMAIGDTIQFQLSSSAGTNTHVYELRLVAERIGG